MLNKSQWTLLPADLVMGLQHLWLSPLGIIPQCDCCSHSIVDYTFSDVNADTVPLTPHDALQFGRAHHCPLLSKIH